MVAVAPVPVRSYPRSQGSVRRLRRVYVYRDSARQTHALLIRLVQIESRDHPVIARRQTIEVELAIHVRKCLELPTQRSAGLLGNRPHKDRYPGYGLSLGLHDTGN